MAKSKQRSPVFPLICAVLIGVIFGVASGALLRMYGAARQVVSAYGVAICGSAQHVVLVYGDGRQRIVKGRDIVTDKDVRFAVEKLPPEKTGVFNVCPPKPELKVY